MQKYNQQVVDNLKEIFYKVHNNVKLSSIEESFLSMRKLKIINDGSEVMLQAGNETIASIPYYTVWENTRKDYAKCDNQFQSLVKASSVERIKEKGIGL